MKNFFLATFVLLLLLPVAFAAIGSSGSYNSWTKIDFIGYNSTGSNYQSRGSGDIITGSFSISSYSGRFGILKYCGNSIIDSGETCDGTNLNSQTCSSRGYLSGTLACNSDCSFDTSGCTPHPPSVRENIPSGHFSGEATPRATKISMTISEEEIKVGTSQVLATNTEYALTLRRAEHRIDVKQITANSVVLWIYSEPEPIEITLKLGEHKRVDLDGDGFGDLWVELRDIRKVVVLDVVSYEAVIYFREMSPVTGAVVREEEIETPAEAEISLPKITLKDDVIKPLGKVVNNLKYSTFKKISSFNSFIKQNIDAWINKAKMQKSWLIPSLITIALLISFLIISFRFYLRKRSKENTGTS